MVEVCWRILSHRAATKRIEVVGLVRLIQLSTVGEVFLEGTCPLSRCPQTAKFPVPMLLGTRRRWVRKATAFRGRSEQDRSALCPICCAVVLKTFRWNVFNGIFLAAKTIGHGTTCPYKVRKTPCQLEQPFRGQHLEIFSLLHEAFSTGSALSESSRNSVGKTTAIKEGKNHDRHQMDPE